MSRSASLLGNTIWIAISVATLLYPCLPARDPNGEVFALSRFDFALIYLASPEALWLQWTVGLPLDYWAVRGSTVAIALTWVVVLGLVGGISMCGPKRFKPHNSENRIASWALGLVLGYSILRGVFYIQGWLPSSFSMPITLFLMTAIPIACYLWRMRLQNLNTQESVNPNKETGCQEEDRSLNQPWKRRLYGLATISCFVLATLHIAGSMVPSVDTEVRNEKWVNTTHAYEQAKAPYLLPQLEDTDLSMPRSVHVTQLDTIAYLSMSLMKIDIRSSSTGMNESSEALGVSAVYPALLASKLVDVIVGIAGFLIIWGRARDYSGRAPAMIMLMLLLATPATLELGRLGRVEWLATTQFAAIISVASWGGKVARGGLWLLISILSIPLLEWFLSLSIQPAIPIIDRLGALLRFVGFSTLFAIPWVGCLAIGVLARPRKPLLVLFGLGFGLFVILSWIGNSPDRTWVPLLSFFALPVASGACWLLQNQNRFVGLIVWFGIMVVSLVNAAYWPTTENRVLAPMEWLVFENWLDYGETQEDVRSRYPIELWKQLREGAINPDSKILLLGTNDDIDIPISCITISPIDKLDKESIASLVQKSKVTHIGIVANPKGSDFESRAIDEDDGFLRSILGQLVDQGVLQKQPVSADCFDLTLFAIRQ